MSEAQNVPTEPDWAIPTSTPDVAPASLEGRDGEKAPSSENPTHLPPSVYVSFPEDQDAIATALPASDDGQSLEQPAGPKTIRYFELIETLKTWLPHLVNVRIVGRQKRVKVGCYDFDDYTLLSRMAFSSREESEELCTSEDVSLRRTLETPPAEAVRLRLIVAADLSTELIGTLGSTLNISPEVFEEHLINSGWSGGTYDDNNSDSWITRDMSKDYL